MDSAACSARIFPSVKFNLPLHVCRDFKEFPNFLSDDDTARF